MGIKNNIFIEDNIMNNSAKFQLYLPYSFWAVNFLIIFHKFNLSVAMATNQIERFQLLYRRPLNKHFCKTFVKISEIRQQ